PERPSATAEQAAPPEAAPVAHARVRPVLPPGIQAQRMHRYSIYLIVLAFVLVGMNVTALSVGAALWFAAGLTAAFSIVLAAAVVILNAIAWNFDRLREELRGGRTAQSVN
ncbi:MAG: hypothetical protein ACE5FJ_12545, partial [Gemmatimonadales bacterium]